jgi:hypothetical protein
MNFTRERVQSNGPWIVGRGHRVQTKLSLSEERLSNFIRIELELEACGKLKAP